MLLLYIHVALITNLCCLSCTELLRPRPGAVCLLLVPGYSWALWLEPDRYDSQSEGSQLHTDHRNSQLYRWLSLVNCSVFYQHLLRMGHKMRGNYLKLQLGRYRNTKMASYWMPSLIFMEIFFVYNSFVFLKASICLVFWGFFFDISDHI